MKSIDTHREACQISVEIMESIKDKVSPGITGAELDNYAREKCAEMGVKSSFYGVSGTHIPFPGQFCFCINDEVLHAIPSAKQVVKDGDLVTIDFGVIHKGYYTDHCMTFGVGEVTAEDKKLLNVGKLAVESAAKKARPGTPAVELGGTIHDIVKLAGLDVVKEYVGHGIGKSLHQSPEIPAFRAEGNCDRLRKGQVICVEAQIVTGSDKLYTTDDTWTIKTRDGQKSVMFEFMVHVQDTPEILTDTTGWGLFI